MLLAAPVAHSQVQLHRALRIEKFLLYSFNISRFASGVNLFLCDWKNVMYVMHEGSFTLHSALSCLHKPIFFKSLIQLTNPGNWVRDIILVNQVNEVSYLTLNPKKTPTCDVTSVSWSTVGTCKLNFLSRCSVFYAVHK